MRMQVGHICMSLPRMTLDFFGLTQLINKKDYSIYFGVMGLVGWTTNCLVMC
jgi:hypothetical protein